MTKVEHKDLDKARGMADMIRHRMPEKAAEIDKALDEFESGEREKVEITMEERATLRKFDGDYKEGKEPVEVLEFDGVTINLQHSQPTQS